MGFLLYSVFYCCAPKFNRCRTAAKEASFTQLHVENFSGSFFFFGSLQPRVCTFNKGNRKCFSFCFRGKKKWKRTKRNVKSMFEVQMNGQKPGRRIAVAFTVSVFRSSLIHRLHVYIAGIIIIFDGEAHRVPVQHRRRTAANVNQRRKVVGHQKVLHSAV